MMHPGYDNPNKIRPTGPTDPDVPVLSLQTLDGKPLAVYTSYSLHYVGAPNISADYFALVCEEMQRLLKAQDVPNFMAAHANATSGDMWLMDYTKPRRMYDRHTVAKEVAAAAYEAYEKIQYFDWAPIVMIEEKQTLNIRKPTLEEVEQAREFVKTFEGRKPKTVPEVYARETLLMHEMPPTRELKLQAIRIGDLGIAAIPNETYASTGLFIKKNSPLKTTMCIELANGCEGYIPPEELHKLGGYTTWRARTSCLQVDAEEKIRNHLVKLLNDVSKLRTDEPAIESKAAGQ
jgi:neutral ceramidase